MEDRLAHWFDIVRDLLVEPVAQLPHVMLLNELMDSLGAKAGSWIHRRADGHVDYHVVSPPEMVLAAEAIEWIRPRLDQHPLLCWFTATADPTAQTVSRVPKALRDPRYDAWQEIEALAGAEHQLAIPLELSGRQHRAFVLVADGVDFADQDLRLARRLQGLLVGLDRQARALEKWMPCASSENDGDLTARELTVLRLIADGMTAGAIGHRLFISPRTVQKHLEHIYAKLGATDKVSAVLRAQGLGLLTVQRSTR
ncbi:helix-turn-helix transcriptional regulator [Streptomyces sp. ID05-26A]|nr:helix-turn-helix transcriptional regulator [Streptomyces sp. ID05-26A]